MAIWQYSLELIPKEGLPLEIYGTESESPDLWSNRNVTIDFFNSIIENLLETQSWSENIKIYGSIDSTCLIFLTEYSIVVEVTIRIDYRNDYTDFVNGIIQFCTLNSLTLFDESLKEIYLNEESIKNVIESSPQYSKLKEFNM